MSLRGKRIAIIGGTSGIGFAVARCTAEEGGDVFIGSRSPESVERAAAQLSLSGRAAVVDTKDERSIAAFIAKAAPIDHLVYTSGEWPVSSPTPERHLQPAEFYRLAAVRFTGALRAVEYSAPLISRGGSISLTDGMVALRPRKGFPLVTAMAGAIEHLVYGLAIDLAPIRVNAVCPGLIERPSREDHEIEAASARTSKLPLNRLGTTDEVAQAYLYLMKAGYTTGQIIRVDGGMSLV